MFGLGPAGAGLRDFRGQRRGGGRQPYAVILALRLLHAIANLERKPPITLALMAGMSLFHLKPDVLQDMLGAVGADGGGGFGNGGWDYWGSWFTSGQVDHVRSVCLFPDAMWDAYVRTGMFDFKRLLVSAFVHGDDMHLYYNMASFLLKGVSLEFSMGSQAYAGLLAFSVVVSQTLLLASSWVLMSLFQVYGPMQACTVGFSGVLFALKYVLARRSPGVTNVMGFKVHTRYAAWLELVLISVLVPNASFLGHLCGILAGVLYVEVPIMLPFLGLFPIFSSGSRFGANRSQGLQRSYTYNRGASGVADRTGTREEETDSNRRANVEERSPTPAPPPSDGGDGDWVAEEEEFQEAIRRSLQDTGGRDTGERIEGRVFEGMDKVERSAYRVTPSAPEPDADVMAQEQRGEEGGAGGPIDAGELRRRRLQRLG